jgi:hypothetical protein
MLRALTAGCRASTPPANPRGDDGSILGVRSRERRAAATNRMTCRARLSIPASRPLARAPTYRNPPGVPEVARDSTFAFARCGGSCRPEGNKRRLGGFGGRDPSPWTLVKLGIRADLGAFAAGLPFPTAVEDPARTHNEHAATARTTDSVRLRRSTTSLLCVRWALASHVPNYPRIGVPPGERRAHHWSRPVSRCRAAKATQPDLQELKLNLARATSDLTFGNCAHRQTSDRAPAVTGRRSTQVPC